jgi:hypothetical protein
MFYEPPLSPPRFLSPSPTSAFCPPIPLSDLTYAADLILRQMSTGIFGCTEEHHRFTEARHYTFSHDDHQSLDITYAGAEAFPASVGLATHRVPSQHGLSRQAFPSESVLSPLFTGCATGSSTPASVCLHLEQVPPVFTPTFTDIDSTIAFPLSLAVIRSEFYYCPTLQYQRTIQTDIHLETSISYETADGTEKNKLLPLRRIPHVYLGAVSGIFDCAMYVFFPHLYSPNHEFKCLTDIQMQRFTDHVMLSSIYEHLPDTALQRFPPGFQAGQFNAAARAHETRTGIEPSIGMTHRGILIQSRFLGDIWTSIQGRIASADLLEFSNAFLCTLSKGHKLQFQETSLISAIDGFYTKIATMFDFQFLLHNQLFTDLAWEICPARTSAHTSDDKSAQVYLFKRCCLEKNLEVFYQDDITDSSGVKQFYNVKFLHEACNLTSVPPKKSRLWAAGLRYTQYYAGEKEICDAGTTYPFANSGLEELSLDPSIWATAANAAKWTGKRSRVAILNGYLESKRRVSSWYEGSSKKSFAVRVEHRITSTLLQEILRLYRLTTGQYPLPFWDHTPSFVWAITTERYVNFVLGNVHKFCATIEVAMLTASSEGLRQSQSYLIYALLKCLRFFFSRSALHIQPTLWYDQREDADKKKRRGLGFESTLAQRGYCWILPIVDWARLQIHPDVYLDLVVNPKEVLGYNWKTREARNALWNLDDLLEYIPRAATHLEQQGPILTLICHICFRRFRQDVLLLIAKETFLEPNEIRSRIESDEIPFCHSEISKYFQTPWLMNRNRSGLTTPEQMFNVFWSDLPSTNRKHYKNKPFREMFAKVRGAIRKYPAVHDVWLSTFRTEFYRFHSLLPYPDSNGTMISTAKNNGRRRWWSMLPKADAFVWGRDQYWTGVLPAYPATLSMSQGEFDAYLNSLIAI